MMAEELMIGDWVIDEYTNRPMRIEAVNKMMGSGLFPIPLTAEILEKNGFKKDEEDDSVFFYEDGVMMSNYFVWVAIIFGVGKVDITTNHNRNSHSYSSRVQKRLYVHELQHKLRDCELFDLANNFKV